MQRGFADEGGSRFESLSESQQKGIDKHQRFQKQHLPVYDQLSSLTRLTTLNLGYESIKANYGDNDLLEEEQEWYPNGGRTYRTGMGPIRGTMELSLSSCLGHLGNLENLEVFGFQGLDHRV